LRIVTALVLVCMYAYLLAYAVRQRRQIAAIAKHTFIETIRAKTMLVLVLFAMVLIASSRFFPVIRTADRLSIVESVCFWSITTFGMIVAIFLAARGITSDITNKTVYTILTKPVRRGGYVLGKAAGFSAAALVMLVVMGGVSLGFIRLVAEEPSRLISRTVLPEGRMFIEGGGISMRGEVPWVHHGADGPVRWRFDDLPEVSKDQKAELHIKLEVSGASGGKSIPVMIQLENEKENKEDFERNLVNNTPISIPLESKFLSCGGRLDMMILPREEGCSIRPDMKGAEISISGESHPAAMCRHMASAWIVWRFKSLPQMEPEDEVRVRVRLPVESAEGGDEIPAIVTLRNVMGEVWPGRAPVSDGSVFEIPFKAGWLGPGQAMSVAVMPERVGDSVGGVRRGVEVLAAGRVHKAERVLLEGIGLSPKRHFVWLSEGPERRVVWLFARLKPSRLPPGEMRGVARLHVGGGERKIRLKMRFINPARPDASEEKGVTVKIKRVRETTGRPLDFAFDRKAVSEDGKLRIEVTRVDPRSRLGIPFSGALTLYGRHASYDVNFAKAMCVIFFQFVLIVCIAVLGSTFLSWPVGILFSFFFFVCGHLTEFMRNAYVVLSPPRGHHHGTESFVSKAFRVVVENVLYVVSFILPDFRKFRVTDRIIEKLNLDFGFMFDSFCYMALFVGISIILAQVIMAKREIE